LTGSNEIQVATRLRIVLDIWKIDRLRAHRRHRHLLRCCLAKKRRKIVHGLLAGDL
jgi:hypothetical protein